MVLAKQNWPASSITSRSRLPGGTRVGLAKSHAVPPITHPRWPCAGDESGVLLLGDLLPADIFAVVAFLCDPQWIDAGIDRTVEQVLHHGMRLRDNTDAPAVLGDQPRDDLRAGIGFAGSGRSVHRHVRRVQVEQRGRDVVDGFAGPRPVPRRCGSEAGVVTEYRAVRCGAVAAVRRRRSAAVDSIDSRSAVVGMGGPGVSANGN